MEEKLTKFEEKIVDFLISHHDQKLVKGKSLVKETKRFSKSKNDIESGSVTSSRPVLFRIFTQACILNDGFPSVLTVNFNH